MRYSIHLLVITAVCTFLFSGCGDRSAPPQESFDQMRDRLKQKVETEHANRESAISEEARGKLPAKSVEDLVESYTLAFNAGDTEALKQMAHMENVPTAQEDQFLTIALSIRSAGGNTIGDVKVQPFDPSDQKEFWSIKPVSMLECTYRANDDSGSGGTEAPIVKIDNHFYFYVCGIPQADAVDEE